MRAQRRGHSVCGRVRGAVEGGDSVGVGLGRAQLLWDPSGKPSTDCGRRVLM